MTATRRSPASWRTRSGRDTRGAYIVKDGRNSPRKIDMAVAAVVAYDRAMQAQPEYDGPLVEFV
jgi:hypothetical protein